MPYDVPLPPAGCAFDHTETRKAWQSARRRVAGGLVVCVLLTLTALAVTGLYAPQIRRAGAGVVPALFFGLLLPCALYSSIGSLRRLGRMRAVLRDNPWQSRAALRRQQGTRDPGGVPVQLMTREGGWSRALTARDPLRWYRWDPAMENGVWMAGSPASGAVVALPGGRGPMLTLERRRRDVVPPRRPQRRDLKSADAPPAG
ncbi:hypothetical protein AR457_19155 [Streptomyces agglomeratus]|uniref:Uncharacterized protein n=1 Tax=Streptomyces agglomeratus TaxID=285458 RepID=A0A1E5P9K6_9ACTN|nr:hypothetical protein [Streptomyces agglomeratus]OEJ26256.1 hypothetical protein AS594_18920 [Streptomyces agglomeratus]OEJ39686.1 hypothetical protein BGK70_17495 [Streptomyces agglomeratus]OEJ45931.1 hypothetical protein AR457_19155 [Streptomyces agglomeratus]OEJ52248.1 hypothetical protein BGK72_17185 [Streptomyces agglomeratus]OEJ59605.1 hypothetical protein BGM19_18035 [Streptomyces agglomeratus]